MRHECSIVRDLLPLYFENMVSDDTAAFIKEHIADCPSCAAELEGIQSGRRLEATTQQPQTEAEAEAILAIRSIRKKFRKKIFCFAATGAGILLLFAILLHFFPICRLLAIGTGLGESSYYTTDEILKALSIGSASDRAEAQAILRLADTAFNDTRHTRAENEEAYGVLARYATPIDTYGDVSFNVHALELWSAHLEADEGWIWVYYSSETFCNDGSTACGSWNIPSLWKVEKSESGAWVVVQIRERP